MSDYKERMAARRESIRQAQETVASWPEWKKAEMRQWREDTKKKIEESMNDERY